MEAPTLAEGTRRGGGGAAGQRNHRLPTGISFRPQQVSPLRTILAAAADARRHGDHGAADQLEQDAVVALRSLRRIGETPA